MTYDIATTLPETNYENPTSLATPTSKFKRRFEPSRPASKKSVRIKRLNQRLGKVIQSYIQGDEQYQSDNEQAYINARNRLVKINMPVIWPLLDQYSHKGISVMELRDIAESKLFDCAEVYNHDLANFYGFARFCIKREFRRKFRRLKKSFSTYHERDGKMFFKIIVDKKQGPLEQAILSEIPVLLEGLEAREADVLKLRYGFDSQREDRPREHSLQEIADSYGISKEMARKIETKALAKLRTKLDPNNEPLKKKKRFYVPSFSRSQNIPESSWN